MRATDNFSGFFTPEDLSQMELELNKDAPATESMAERESRALAIVLSRQSRDPPLTQKNNRNVGTDPPSGSLNAVSLAS
ncbi:hypothetical protein [Mesorhizobium sp. Root552]|jgi:hypothetical protein|uniref:hypothetical protein n=1 Tax=Mesorhizobium sp. Root552 TaxID=1736555 RepID=UPI000A5F5893|nr:hypothetical protein [Mesorhizobium sp. Root552]